MSERKRPNLHVIAVDFPFELLAILGGEIPCTIGNREREREKRGGCVVSQSDQLEMVIKARTLVRFSSAEQSCSWADLDRCRRRDIRKTCQVRST